jgi:hypothetical protein
MQLSNVLAFAVSRHQLVDTFLAEIACVTRLLTVANAAGVADFLRK